MKIISILIKINFVILTLLILGLIYSLITDGVSILLPGLGLIVSGPLVLLLMIAVNLAVTALLMLIKRMLAASNLR